MLFSIFVSLLLQIVYEQCVEVYWCKVKLWEGVVGNQVGDVFVCVWEQNVWVVCVEVVCYLGVFDVVDGENIVLLYFIEECGFFVQCSGYGYMQYYFINVFSQLGGGGIQIKFNFWLLVFLENLWCVWCFKRDIFGIDMLDLEGYFGVVLF